MRKNQNLLEVMEVILPFFIVGVALIVGGAFLPTWGDAIQQIGVTIASSIVGVFGYYWVVEILAVRQKRQLAIWLQQARQAKGLTQQQVCELTGIPVADLELNLCSRSYFPGKLTQMVNSLSLLYDQPIRVGSFIA